MPILPNYKCDAPKCGNVFILGGGEHYRVTDPYGETFNICEVHGKSVAPPRAKREPSTWQPGLPS